MSDPAVRCFPLLPTLPDGWHEGRSRAVIRRAIMVETIPAEDLIRRLGCPSTHKDGYVRLYLGKGHPYAHSGGQQYLHRYIMCRHLRRPLLPCEHVHHKALEDGTFAPKDTHELAHLELMLDQKHGHYHWHWHGPCECEPLDELEAEHAAYVASLPPPTIAGNSF